MTEMSPIGSHGQLFSPQSDLPIEKKTKLKTTQGRRLFGVDMKLIDSDGNQVAHDGKSVGELYVRGNTVVARYFNETAFPVTKLDNDGWFGTGDVAKIDPKGFLTITDRSKDLIKSGGEWISSIELENIAMAHGGILSCAAIGAYHPKWGERPLLIVVTHDGRALDTNNILDLIKKKVPNWQVPDDVVFIPSLPLTATGKVSKLQLRLEYKNYFYPAGGS
jgi:fatty-acyl-CoA synthase